MLRKQVDIVRDEYLRHRMNGNLCSCDEKLDRNNLFAFAEHVAVKTVLALEEYALLNPEKASPEPVTVWVDGDMIRVGLHLVPRSKIRGTQPTLQGNYEVTWTRDDGTERKTVVSALDFMDFNEDMWGKK